MFFFERSRTIAACLMLCRRVFLEGKVGDVNPSVNVEVAADI